LLFIGDYAVKTIDPEKMPALEAIINLPDFSLMISRSEKVSYAREHLNMLFCSKFPRAFRSEHVNYHQDQAEELALINYTSGTTGFSKGVMLPYRALWGNVEFIINHLGKVVKPGDNMLSILPMAHMYGMAIEFLFGFCNGCHLFFLTRLPSPAIIAEAFATVKPSIIITVPLIIEKIIRKKVFPKIQNNRMRLLLAMPVISKKVRELICKEVINAFGGELYEVIIGGAAFNKEVESFLKRIEFPYTVGYGATECAPIICYRDWKTFVLGSCGQEAYHMKVKINSSNPAHIPGEILAKGPNVMLGYYKNEEATRETLDSDGWYHTGDLGTMDFDGNVFINGRSKNMLLGANGQNIYPEEIEDKLNSMTMVVESVVVQRDQKLVGLVYPDYDEAKNMNFNDTDIANVMEQNRIQLNEQLPAYEKITEIEIRKEEFEKTPKRSIKRFLYT
jgi:long-chain acyl-CoA synthetase